MTKEELRERLRNLRGAAVEVAHYEADRALLDYIDDPEITHAYDAVVSMAPPRSPMPPAHHYVDTPGKTRWLR